MAAGSPAAYAHTAHQPFAACEWQSSLFRLD
jgi:hypothetical protein